MGWADFVGLETVKCNKNIFLFVHLLDMAKPYGKILACKLVNYFMEFEMVTFASLQEKSTLCRSGCYTVFMKIGKVGVKLFQREDDRDVAFNEQCKAHNCGLGPKAIKKFHFFDAGTNEFWYAYTTEVVKTFKRGRIRGKAEFRIETMIDELKEKLLKENLDIDDLHYYNVGVSKGKLVRIDFGPTSSVQLPACMQRWD
jgi:hypothetical protein